MGARPPLTVCGMTWNSGDRLERWLTRSLEFADEVVLLVDQGSTDDTLEVACAYADQVQVVEHPPFIEVAMDWGLRKATGEWVLWLDDDELVSTSFAEARDRLLADPDLTHYWLPYRWLVPGADGGYRWLRQFPWYPNERLRLIRNVGSIYHHRGRLHSPIEVAGDGRVIDLEEGVIYHLDLAWRSRAEREAKVARYRGNNAPSCEEYYLYEDYAATLRSEPVDATEVTRPATAAARQAAQERRERFAAAPGLRGPNAAAGSNLDPDVATVAVMQARLARYWDNADVFSAEYVEHDTPATVLPNRGYAVELAVRNTSAVPWRNSGPLRGRVAMSYHWAHPEIGMLLEHGDRTLLPHVVEPGEVVRFPAGIWTPFEPGRYLLRWDLRVEEIGWFSDRGVAPLQVEVEVTGEELLAATPREVATLPARAHAERAPATPAHTPPLVARLRPHLDRALAVARRPTTAFGPRRPGSGPDFTAANVVPVRPVRVLDTRDGTGNPGAVVGPVAAGDVVEVAVGGEAGIPSHTVGVVATLSVLHATYDGFVTAFPADGTAGDAFVSAYFQDQGSPTAGQVVVGLGRGPWHGKLALRPSDNHPGGVHLVVDVVAYLD